MFQLFLCLHTFRHHTQIQPVRQTNDITECSAALRHFHFGTDKLHIQLQDIHGHPVQHVQRGITASKIIHLDNKAIFPQLRHRLDQLVRIFRIDRLRNLQMESLWCDPVAIYQLQQDIYQIYVVDIRPGNIDGNIDRLQTFPVPLPHQPADLFPYVLIQPSNETVFFKERDKHCRRLHAKFRVEPADQRLCIGKQTSKSLVFRLKLYLELSFLQCLFHAVQDRLLLKHFIPKFVIIKGKIPSILSFNASGPLQRTVTHLLYGDLSVVSHINAPFDHNVADAAFFSDLCSELLKKLICIAFLMFLHADKLVCIKTTADPMPFLRMSVADLRYDPKHPVAGLHTEGIVEQLEILCI